MLAVMWDVCRYVLNILSGVRGRLSGWYSGPKALRFA